PALTWVTDLGMAEVTCENAVANDAAKSLAVAVVLRTRPGCHEGAKAAASPDDAGGCTRAGSERSAVVLYRTVDGFAARAPPFANLARGTRIGVLDLVGPTQRLNVARWSAVDGRSTHTHALTLVFSGAGRHFCFAGVARGEAVTERRLAVHLAARGLLDGAL
ncbi:MAG: hypothetical protein ACI9OJ_005239, partial [Myxococcota bacterium]